MYILWAALAHAAVEDGTWTALQGERVVLTSTDGRSLTGELTGVDEDSVQVRVGDRTWSIPKAQVEAAALAEPRPPEPAPEPPEPPERSEPAELSEPPELSDLRMSPEYRAGWADGTLAAQQLSVRDPAIAGAACGTAGGAGCCFVGPVCALPVVMTPVWIYSSQDYPAPGLTDPYELGYHEGMAEMWLERSSNAALGGSVIGGVVGFGLLLSGWATWMAWQNGTF